MSLNDLPEGFEPTTPTGLPVLDQPVGFEPTDNSFISPATKKIASDIYSPVLKYGGAMAAGLAVAPETLGSASIPAGTLGYGIGAELADKLDELIGVSAPPSNVKKIIEKSAGNLVEGAFQETLGQATAPYIEKGLNSTIGAASALAVKGPEKLAKISEMASKLGINLTPAELAGTKMLNGFESILDNLPWTSNIIQAHRLNEMQKLNTVRNSLIEKGGNGSAIEDLGLEIKAMADKYIQKIGAVNKEAQVALKDRLLQKLGSKHSYGDLDISAKEVVQRYQQKLGENIDTAYKAVAKQAPTDSFVPEHTIEAANKIIEEQNRIAPSARNNDLLRAAKFFTETEKDIPEEIISAYKGTLNSSDPTVKNMLENEYPGLLNPQAEKTYLDLSENVKAFNLKKYAQVDSSHGAYQISNAGRQWNTLIDGLHKDMESGIAFSGNEELVKAHQIASGLYKKKLALFEDPAFKLINDKYPGSVATTILKSGNSELVDRYRALVGEPLFNKAKDRLTNDVLGLNKDTVIGDDIRKELLNLGPTINKIYSSSELEHFKAIARAVDLRAGATNDLLNNPYLKKMISNNAEFIPSGIAKSLVSPNNAGAAGAIENTFGTAAKKKVADAFLPHLLSANQEGNFMPQTFAKEFDKYGKRTLESWYGKEFTNELEQLAGIGKKMKGVEGIVKNASAPGKYIIGFYEGSRILTKAVHAVTSGFSAPAVLSLGTDGAVILGTRELAKLYTNPIGKHLFINGLITPVAAKEAGQITSKIISIVGNEIMRPKKERN